jgi:hypothetical protein
MGVKNDVITENICESAETHICDMIVSEFTQSSVKIVSEFVFPSVEIVSEFTQSSVKIVSESNIRKLRGTSGSGVFALLFAKSNLKSLSLSRSVSTLLAMSEMDLKVRLCIEFACI